MVTTINNAPAKGEGKRGRWQTFTGTLLTVTGFFWLAKNAGWIQIEHNHSAVIWPVVVMAAGVFMLFHDRPARSRHRA